MFNLKKYSQTSKEQVEHTETMLKNERKDHDTEAVDDSGNIEYRLEEDRKPNDGQELIQKQLEEVRVANDGQEITEAATERSGKGKFNLMKHREDKRQMPLMDYAKTNEFSNEKDIKKEGKKDRDTEFWDKFIGEQLDYEPTKIVSNSQPSQLLSNFETREDFEKENNSIKTASIKALADADAMLYYIYRSASSEDRQLTQEEEQMVGDINSGKIRILAELSAEDKTKENEELNYEKSTIAADDLELKKRDEADILKDQQEIAGL